MNAIKKANVTHLWSVLCRSATIDAANSDLSLFKTIDELAVTFPSTAALQSFSAQAAQKPVGAPMPCELVTLWKKIDRAKPADFESRVLLRDSEGTVLMTSEIPIEMTDGKFRHRHRLSLPVVPITVPGEYVFAVEARAKGEEAYETVAEIPLDISFKLEKPKEK